MGEWLSNSPPKLADVAEWLSNLPDLSCITDECEGDKENLFDERAAPVSVLPCTSLGSSNTPAIFSPAFEGSNHYKSES